MSEKTLKFDNIVVIKKEFHASEKPIALNLVDIGKIVISDKFNHNDKGPKYFIGCLHDNIIRSLCIVLPYLSGYVINSDDCGKNMSLEIEDHNTFFKYKEILNKIKKTLNIKFHTQPV